MATMCPLSRCHRLRQKQVTVRISAIVDQFGIGGNAPKLGVESQGRLVNLVYCLSSWAPSQSVSIASIHSKILSSVSRVNKPPSGVRGIVNAEVVGIARYRLESASICESPPVQVSNQKEETCVSQSNL